MIFRQLIHDDLGCASYLVGDEDAGVAAVVDPSFEIDRYLALARYMRVSIEHVLETHNHADHVSGHGRLRAATGCRIHINRAARAGYEHDPLDDGDALTLGALTVRALHTPGHRPEHTAFVLSDTVRADEPSAVLTGDSLFVGDVARPDLAVESHEGARDIFRTLHGRLLTLPSETEVWPAHLGGSLCGGPGMDMKTSSTIGYEARHNALLGETDERRFVDALLAALGPQPPRFESVVALNRGPLVTAGVDVMPLTPRQVEHKRGEGALVVDVRTDLQFDGAHIPGSVAITALHAGFGTKLAWVAEPGQEIVFVGRDDDDGRRAARLATAVGIRDVGGLLAGGMTSWRDERREVRTIGRIAADELPSLSERVQILDVREHSEWRAGYIPGSLHVPYHDIYGLPPGIDTARPVACVCSSGERAAVAASLLERHGARAVLHVVGGGVGTWERAGHPIERG